MTLRDVFIIKEAVEQLPWKYSNDVWWQENCIFYHGTHIDNLSAIEKNGLIAGPGSKGIGVYLALDPFTARGYASMAAAGGEAEFKKSEKPRTTPINERAVIVVRLPQDVLLKLKVSAKDKRIFDKETWQKEGKGNIRYWELAEVVYPIDLPSKYIVGYMLKG